MSLLIALALFGPPLAGAAAATISRRSIARAAWFNAATMPICLGTASLLAFRVASGVTAIAVWPGASLDALSALLMLLVGTVATLSSWMGPGLTTNGAAPPPETRAFRIYINLFTATMLMAVTTPNLGLMWVAIESSTVASVLLIPIGGSKASIEASWKYLLIGSVGIALALTGTVLALVDYTATGGSSQSALTWTTLVAAAPSLHPEVMRLAFVFFIVGFGTKAGLAPMHTWLPDAHSEAPAPLSAMMSGVMLAVALYALARWKAIVDLAAGSHFTDTLLLVVAMATMLVGSLSLATQQHYKRLLAYSSIEHTGLACFGLALGPAGVAAALLHLTGHALSKSVAFLLSGRVLERYRSHDIARTPGVLVAMPATGALFAASAIALAGLPPFGLFLSELLLIRAGWSAGHVVLTGVVLLLMLMAFGSLVYQLQRMLLGAPPEGVTVGERAGWSSIILVAPLVALVWLGVSMPAIFQSLLERAAAVLHP